MSSNYRKPRIFLDYKKNPATDLKTLTTLRKEGGHLVSGDIVIKDNGIFIQHNHRLRRITWPSEFFCIDKEYSGITDDAMDYFSVVREDAKSFGLRVLISFPTTDRTFLSLNSRIRNTIEHATLDMEELQIMFSWGNCRTVTNYWTNLMTIPLDHIGTVEQRVLEMFCPFVTAILIGPETFNTECLDPSVWEVDYRYVSLDEKVTLCNKEFDVRRNEKMVLLTGPKVFVQRTVVSLSASFPYLKHVLTTYPESVILFRRKPGVEGLGLEVDFHKSRIWQRKDRHEMIIDVCLALYRLDIPNYVMLEIIDWLPNMEYHNHVKKIELIFNVKESCERVINRRT